GEQRLGLGGQQSGTVQFGRVEWLHAEAVARGEEDALPRVPECEGEFALEMRKAAYAMILIEMDEDLAVRPAPEPMALLRKLGADAIVVVEFPVHHGHHLPILVCKRLLPALGIDHCKPGMAEPCPPVRRDMDTASIRATMGKGRSRAPDILRLHRLPPGEDGKDAAHGC